MENIKVGFIGSGGIARSHAFAINSLKYYYNDSPGIDLLAVCSATPESRKSFALKYGFREALALEDFTKRDIDTVFILGPNKVHYEHFRSACDMPSVKRIYIEKPLCSDKNEETSIAEIAGKHPGIRIQAGFQFLFMPSVRVALNLWKSGKYGKPLHFELKYYHGDYLKKEYRDKRVTRLTPAPDGGAMADLGSHSISMLTAFLGNNLTIKSAIQAGNFADVDIRSDLFSLITLLDLSTGAAGSISASRIASGSGDTFSMELFAEKGAIRFSSLTPDFFEHFTEESGIWNKVMTSSNFRDITTFPAGYLSPGWLRSMIHAHYVFLTGNDAHEAFIPDLHHSLTVQKLVRETAEHLAHFRS